MKKRVIWLLLALAVGLGGCAGDGTSLGPDGQPLGDGDENGEPVDVPTLAQLSQQIFTPRCATSGCHDAGGNSGGLVLAADRIAEQIVGMASSQQPDLLRIDPGNPADSYLLRKVEGRDISSSQMPLTGNLLTDDQLELIRRWIEAGAPLE